MILDVYVDGSWTKRSPEVTTGSVVIVKDFDNYDEVIQVRHVMTDRQCFVKSKNVGGEIVAALVGIMDACHLCNGEESIVNVYYDYRGIRDFIIGRAAGGYEAQKEGPIIYVRAVKSVLTQNHNVDLKFHKVVAHTGNKYNELADTIARGVIPSQYEHCQMETFRI